MHEDQELSLRDLYLILSRSWLFIVSFSLAAGLLVFVYLSMQPQLYEAETTSLVNPVSMQEGGSLSFRQSANVGFESYRTLALSRPVFEATLAAFPELGWTLRDLEQASRLELLLGVPDRRPELTGFVPLSVTHTVRSIDPEQASELSQVWTEQTLEAVRNTLLASLSPVANVTNSQVARLSGELEEADEALRLFRSSNNLELSQERVESLTSSIAEQELERSQLLRELRVAEARRDLLSEQLRDESLQLASLDPSSDNFLVGLSLRDAQNFVQSQLEQSQSRRQTQRDLLDAFDNAHNLTLLNNRVRQLTNRIASNEDRLNALPAELQEAQVQVQVLEQQSQAQAPLLTLSDTVFAQDILSEVLRQSDSGFAAIIGTRLEREMLNEVYTNRSLRLVEAQVRRDRLVAEQQALQEAILDNRQQLQTLNQEFITRRSERELLEQDFERLDDEATLLQGRAEQLALAVNLPEAENRRLRAGLSSPMLALEQELRSAEREQLSISTALSSLEDSLEADQQRLLLLQEEFANLRSRRDRLELFRDNARDAYQEIVRLQPFTSYIAELAPAGAQILNAAAIPQEPLGRQRLLSTLIALVLGAIFAVVIVFLRAAVSLPNSDNRPASTRPAASGQRAV